MPGVFALAYKYLAGDDGGGGGALGSRAAEALVVNANLGGDSCHRGSLLGLIIGAACGGQTVTQTTAAADACGAGGGRSGGGGGSSEGGHGAGWSPAQLLEAGLARFGALHERGELEASIVALQEHALRPPVQAPTADPAAAAAAAAAATTAAAAAAKRPRSAPPCATPAG